MKRSTNLKLFPDSDNMFDMNNDQTDIMSMSHMDIIAIELYEMYESLQRAGFTEKQAIEIISFAVASGVMLPNKFIEDSPETDSNPDEGLDLI